MIFNNFQSFWMLPLGAGPLPDWLGVLSWPFYILNSEIGGGAVIDSATVAQILAVLMGCWAMGYGIGKTVAFVRKMGTVI